MGRLLNKELEISRTFEPYLPAKPRQAYTSTYLTYDSPKAKKKTFSGQLVQPEKLNVLKRPITSLDRRPVFTAAKVVFKLVIIISHFFFIARMSRLL